MNTLKALIILIFVGFALSQTTFYTHNGENNNQKNPKWGSKGSILLRNTILTYDDNFGSPFGGIPSRLNSTRAISNLLFGREAAGMRKTSSNFTDLLTYWGQIVDHDLSLSLDSSSINACENFRIPIPAGDYFYDKSGTGNVTMGFCRTLYVNGTGTDVTNIRQLPNAINSWLDASVIYGSDDVRATALRSLEGGLMKTSDGPDGLLLPINDNGNGSVLVNMDNNSGRVASTLLFAAGEQRANENSILTCLQTLMIREHNRRANSLPSDWTDEQKYQEARKWVTAHFQAITFNEFLPTLLATKLPPYQYDPTLDPQITLFFSTVAFRYGHDEISGILKRYEKNGAPYKDGHILLRDAYTFPDSVKLVGIAPYLRGAAISEQSLADSMLEEDLRTFLFSQSAAFATDLAARNMQRARDHGIGMYNDCRKAYKLSTCDTFECVNNDPKIIELLNQAYGKDNVTYLDPFLGGLLESKIPGSNLGLLFHTAIQEQFIRTRNADRFWYQNDGMFTKEELIEIENTKISDIFERNMDMEKMPSDLFVIRDTPFITSLGTCSYDKTRWIVPIIVLGSLSAALIIVVHVLSFIIFRNKARYNSSSSNDTK